MDDEQPEGDFDIEEEELSSGEAISRQAGISDIFYHFERYTNLESGRAVGRKIGVVQEIIVRKLILRSPILSDAVVFEPALPGYSGATHKVEFVFFQPMQAVDLTTGQSVAVGEIQITVNSIRPSGVQLSLNRQGVVQRVTLASHQLYPVQQEGNSSNKQRYAIKVYNVQQNRLRLVILDPEDVIASVESKRVGAQRFKGQDRLGSGIQTIEKAKQAALVAIDADLKFNGHLKSQQPDTTHRRYISVVVLGNGVHWTTKDKHVLGTYVDYTFLVPDATIIRYADWVLALAESKEQPFLSFFQKYFEGMTKTPPDSFEVNDGDFLPIVPANGTMSLTEVLEAQINDYPVTNSGTETMPFSD